MPPVYRLVCQGKCPNPGCGTPIVLPRQSPVGMFPGLLSHPTDKPTAATFLCTVCGQLFECSPEAFPPHRIEIRSPDQQLPLLWRLEFECVIENCGKQKPIFFAFDPIVGERAVWRQVVKLLGEVTCGKGHTQKLLPKMASVVPVARQS
jgi:hypothetical protein